MTEAETILAEDEVEKSDIVIAAAENWSKLYSKSPESHAKLIRVEAKLARIGRRYFRELGKERVNTYINWGAYRTEQIKAYDVNVVFDQDQFQTDESSLFLKLIHDPLLAGMGAGIDAGQDLYSRDIGLSTESELVLKQARSYSAKLVTDITDTTRQRIQQSLLTSLTLGENQSDASSRIAGIVNDSSRADMIARTEAVNSYNGGLMTFGKQSGAIGKVWQDVGAEDICADNSDAGQIDIDDTFPSGDDAPAAHPNCRCGMQLIYDNGNDEDS